MKPDRELSIVCVDNRGLTFVGHVDIDPTSDWVEITDARCIIYWGTSKHIAQLCDGPSSSTKLGETRTVIVRKSNIVFMYHNVKGKWYS